MVSKGYNVEIIIPEEILLKDEAVDFVAPGVIGQFEVLYNHDKFLSVMDVGSIRFTSVSGMVDYYATSGGIVEVQKNLVTVLADTAEKKEEIDFERAKSSLNRARKRLEERFPDTDLLRAEISLRKALNRLKVYSISK